MIETEKIVNRVASRLNIVRNLNSAIALRGTETINTRERLTLPSKFPSERDIKVQKLRKLYNTMESVPFISIFYEISFTILESTLRLRL